MRPWRKVKVAKSDGLKLEAKILQKKQLKLAVIKMAGQIAEYCAQFARAERSTVLGVRIADTPIWPPLCFTISDPVGSPLYHFFQDVGLADHSRLNKPGCFRYPWCLTRRTRER